MSRGAAVNAQKMRLAISFGGSKIALGLVASRTPDLIAQSGRVEWRPRLKSLGEFSAGSLLNLVVLEAAGLLNAAGATFEEIELVGCAWPGPGRYSQGLVSATFLPGFEEPQDLHSMLRSRFATRFGPAAGTVPMLTLLDASARARGELLVSGGAFGPRSPGKPNGLLVNIATGIAGAIVRRGEVLTELDGYGETYGLWGRYLFRDLAWSIWTWRGTEDGSVPQYEPGEEVRFTEFCGGPALARAYARIWVHHAGSADLRDPGRKPILTLARSPERDPQAEKQVLEEVTLLASRGVPLAKDFVDRAGTEIGLALRALRAKVSAEVVDETIVLGGGIGEFFGKAPRGEAAPDPFLAAAQSALGVGTPCIVRSTAGIRAELIGCVAQPIPKANSL